MASALNTKINSYTLERGIEFSETYSLTPTRTGSNPLGTYILSNTPDPVYESTVGPIGGSGSWKFVSKSSGSVRFRTTSTNEWLGVNDADYTQGFWFSVGSIPSLTSAGSTPTAATIYALLPVTGIGFNVSIAPSNTTATQGGVSLAGKILIQYESTSYVIGPTYEANKWYYIATRRIGSTIETYINGSLVQTQTIAPSATATSMSFGAISNPITTSDTNFWVSNFHQSTSSILNATAIAEIWAVGSSINKTITETPATASALMTDPTIAVQSGNHTEITTSILVSAEFPSNIGIVAQANINNVITETLTALVEMINNVDISTGSDASYSSQEMTASALMVEPIPARDPMLAIATMGNHIGSVSASYYSLVKNLNPYLYINNGQTTASIVNYGYQSGTFVKGVNLSILQNPGLPLSMVAEGKCWLGSNANNSYGFITFETTNYADSFNNLVGSGNFAYEIWVKPNQLPDALLSPSTQSSYSILNSEKLKLTLEDYWIEEVITGPNSSYSINHPRYFSLIINNTSTNTTELTYPIDNSSFSANNWNHVVVNIYQSGINTNQRLVQLWINGTIVINQNISFTAWTDNTDKINYILGSNASGLDKLSDMYYDECAIYSAPLTNSQIIQHNNFIGTLSPDYNNISSPLTVSAQSGDHAFVVTSNVNAIATPITGSGLFANPAILAVKNVDISSTTLTASATNTNVTIYWGWTIYATPATAYAEKPASYFLNDLYYQYVQTNITPYRYVTFDSANALLDYGTDTDYSVTSTTIGGDVVNPDLGINGKSVKTAGISYITDGIILNESEWNDDWGTGNNDYVSSFWMQRALDDTSTTGLRVLWNLNGYNDNQHVVVYHYQNKLHFQINNQSGTYHTVTSANNVNIFDYNRHHIVIYSHFNNNHNYISIYVDGISIIGAHDIGNYKITTLNATSADSGPNNESNNRARLSVGCLITPFGSTALPVQPTNTKLIVDEIFWDKDAITQNQVTGLYAAMPDKNNKTIVAEAMTVSVQSVMPAIHTQAILSVNFAIASAELVEPSLYIERFIINTTDVMTASVLMTQAVTFVPVQINADVMVATSTFDNAGVKITIPGGPMSASAKIVDTNFKINGWPIVTMTSYVRYLRIQNLYGTKIYSMKEIK